MSTPRIYQFRPPARVKWRLSGPLSRSIGLIILVPTLLAATLYSASSASSFSERLSHRPESLAKGEGGLIKRGNSFEREALSKLTTQQGMATLPGLAGRMLLSAPQNAPLAETVTTYASDCTTLQSNFNLGDTVCAKMEGGLPLSIIRRRFSWVSSDNFIRQLTNVTTDPQTDLFIIPAAGSDTDPRGVWRVNSISSRASVRASAFITVSDPNDKVANLSVYNNINTDASAVAAGSNVEFALWIVNQGPDDALSVQVTDSVAANATFIVSPQDSGPIFSCSPTGGGATCTLSKLDAGATARIRFVYQTDAGATSGTNISNTATISSSTTEQNSDDNSSTAQVAITSNGGSFCSLACPDNVIKAADTTQGNQPGAFVTFAGADPSGDCGTVTASPASGSFFPVGDTTVTQTSSTGESCTFLVRVTNSAAPTISCPANVVKDAGTHCSAEVTAAELGTPTATGNGVTVDGQRSDGAELDASYPVGTTTVTWTATDTDNRNATCQQTVTVTGSDTTPPTITAPADVTDSTGTAGAACGKILSEADIGTPTADDNCSAPHVTRTGVPPGDFFPIGTTTITYTATDGSGNSATATQRVIISDNTPPTIRAPADASYVCPSDVPAASPSQATGADDNLPNGGPPTDNCGTPTITVTETRSGAGSDTSPLIITRTFTATDSAGNSAEAVQTITVIDNTPPTLTLNGAASMTVECHTTFTDPGASSSDNCAGPVPVTTTGSVNANTPGTYTLGYTATDAAGNTTGPITRTVTVVDTIAPTIALNGANPQYVECHTSYQELGATANDSCGGTSAASPSGTVNVNTPGTYTINYNASDAAGNHAAQASRTVIVRDTTAPTVTLNGANPQYVECHTSYTELGATGNDSCYGSLPATPSGTVNVNTPGTYTIIYSSTDAAANTGTATRTVIVRDTIAPTTTFNNLSIFLNNLTIVFNTNSFTVNGTTYPFNGVSCTHSGYTFTFNGQTVTVTSNGNSFTYTFSGNTLVLWTPTHQYQTVKVVDLIASATDGCDGGVDRDDVVISQVTSDEPDDIAGSGDGNTVNDIVIAPGCKSVQLRAERDSSGNGRVYTITFRVRDASGNTTTVTSKLKVYANSFTVVDDGPHYTVNGTCP